MQKVFETDKELEVVLCGACGAVNSMRWGEQTICIDDKRGLYLDLTFDFCEERGKLTKVDLS